MQRLFLPFGKRLPDDPLCVLHRRRIARDFADGTADCRKRVGLFLYRLQQGLQFLYGRARLDGPLQLGGGFIRFRFDCAQLFRSGGQRGNRVRLRGAEQRFNFLVQSRILSRQAFDCRHVLPDKRRGIGRQQSVILFDKIVIRLPYRFLLLLLDFLFPLGERGDFIRLFRRKLRQIVRGKGRVVLRHPDKLIQPFRPYSAGVCLQQLAIRFDKRGKS